MDHGPPHHLEWTTPLAHCSGGFRCAQQPVISVLDKGDNIVSSSSDVVRLSLSTSGASGDAATDFTGSTSRAAEEGVANFGVVGTTGINPAGTHEVRASIQRPEPGTSGEISVLLEGLVVSIGPPHQMIWSVLPGGCTGGVPCQTQPVLHVVDLGGNIVDSYDRDLVLEEQSGPTPVIHSTLRPFGTGSIVR